MKRLWKHSHDLLDHEKLAIAECECLNVVGLPIDVPRPIDLGNSALASFAMEHCEVNVTVFEVSRLQSKAPRQSLCKYFASSRDALLREIRLCFTDSTFGPGASLEQVEAALRSQAISNVPHKGSCAPPVLLLPHGGFCNSGFVAAHAFQLLADVPVSSVVIIGNNHSAWHKFALSDQVWATPIGIMQPDLDAVNELVTLGYEVDCKIRGAGHSNERESSPPPGPLRNFISSCKFKVLIVYEAPGDSEVARGGLAAGPPSPSG